LFVDARPKRPTVFGHVTLNCRRVHAGRRKLRTLALHAPGVHNLMLNIQQRNESVNEWRCVRLNQSGERVCANALPSTRTCAAGMARQDRLAPLVVAAVRVGGRRHHPSVQADLGAPDWTA
jgi:hypothetical protein